jgi:hypothetical protein
VTASQSNSAGYTKVPDSEKKQLQSMNVWKINKRTNYTLLTSLSYFATRIDSLVVKRK